MSEVPRITGKQAVNAFENAGFHVCRISGSHHIMKKDGWANRLSIPVHGNKIVGLGLLRCQIKDAGLTVDQFLDHLEE
jgi:predicted RNA binding protein YcfA (HicA-like mRNA interferase family)